MIHVFGPVPSRRLGLSLGVDLLPVKTCSYDCLYCQVGRTTAMTIEPGEFCDLSRVLEELGQTLDRVTPDVITLSGSGEPTLHLHIDQVIDFVKTRTDRKIAVLTNGSLLWREEVRAKISGAHVILPTLATVFEGTFRRIHRPHPDLRLPLILRGIKDLRQSFKGGLFLEVMLLAGLNDSEAELDGLRKIIQEISPDRVQLNTVARPPADGKALPLDRQRLEEIKSFFGDPAEIIVGTHSKKTGGKGDPSAAVIVEMAKRRPVRVQDVALAVNQPVRAVQALIKGLVIKGALSEQQHGGEIYYIGRNINREKRSPI